MLVWVLEELQVGQKAERAQGGKVEVDRAATNLPTMQQHYALHFCLIEGNTKNVLSFTFHRIKERQI